jgi:multiple sugar transport system permease protein
MAQQTTTARAGDQEAGHAANWLRALRGVRGERRGEMRAGLLFIAPALIMFIVFNAYPLFRAIWMAFTDYRYLIPGHAPFIGFGNWNEMIHDPVFWQALRRSLEYFAIFTVITFVLAFVVAVLITEIRGNREASVYRALVYLPVVLPIAVAVLVWKQLLNHDFGYLDIFLKNVVHLPRTPDFIRDATWTVPVLAVIAAWRALGSNILLLLVGLYSINAELYEAAEIDGAGWWRRLFSITLPLMRPTFVIIFVLSAGVLGTVEESLVFFGVTDAGPQEGGRLIGRYAYEVAFLRGDLRWGYASAINLTVALISMLISLAIFRLLRTERTS